MRGARTAAAVLLVTAVSGCGQDEVVVTSQAEPSTPTRWTLDGPGTYLSGSLLSDALLEEKDLKAQGWSGIEVEDRALDLATLADVRPQACADWFARYVKGGLTPEVPRYAMTQFRQRRGKGQGPVSLRYSLTSFKDPQNAARLLDFQRQGRTACATFSGRLRSNPVEGGMEALEFQRPGDDSLTNRLTIRESSGQETTVHVRHFLQVQVGHTVISPVVDAEENVPDGTLQEVLDVGFRRLEDNTPKPTDGR